MKSLKNFMSESMKLSSYYQPLIISVLLDNNGKATLETIANRALELNLTNDKEKLIKALKVHPKEVLKKHNVAFLEKGIYTFSDELIIDCDSAFALAFLK